ncbi:carbamoyltransferase HypF [Novipirellula artificiosorum]|nr:carbamoyltransferase HypF [Novipirellula artificiosorum]
MVQVERWRVRVKGVVQGVGFRPFVWHLARTEGVAGWVRNDSLGVLIEIQGPRSTLQHFCDRIQAEAPPLSIVSDVCHEVIEKQGDESTFRIETCQIESDPLALVSPDVSICSDCLAELEDPTNRRYRYPFTNCTACGPRYTIITDLPYDRDATTMADFRLCPTCRDEYGDPADRRFHAEPNACPECGPAVWFVPGDSGSVCRDDDAIEMVKQRVAAGGIVAIKGVGGFHLACDAHNRVAVNKLRSRKHRAAKPFAVMVADLATCERFAILGDTERALLVSRQRPIVLLRRQPDTHDWCESVAPGNDFIGVMLAYSPLHALLVDRGEVWVMTSGNQSDEPIAFENDDAMDRLKGIADVFLLHDRRIETVCDDSVIRVVEDRSLPIRRSRGYAPLPITLPTDGLPLLAVGAEIKATVCLTKGTQCFLSQHIGDMGNQQTLLAMQRVVHHLLRLYQVEPEIVVADMHPGYLSSAWAERFSKTHGVPLRKVQHHHAHVASLLAEHSVAPETAIIGVCFDGTGYGTDGAIWGGEWLIANAFAFQRYAHLSYVPLPGGDACIRYPARMALAHLFQAGIDWADSLRCVKSIPPQQRRLLQQQLERSFHCVPSSSMGRLFDAVASLCGVRHQVSYEGQAAMESEAIASDVFRKGVPSACSPLHDGHRVVRSDKRVVTMNEHAASIKPYEIAVINADVTQVDSGRLIEQVVSDLHHQRPASEILARFHLTIAESIVKISIKARTATAINQVGLTGGVFQNALLTQLARRRLVDEGFEVLTHTTVPPNDGGLALGQAWIGRQVDCEDFG